MKKKNGFTLVELLAVIVVLALIMILAIPAVLDVMNGARKSTFAQFAQDVVRDVQIQYTYDAYSKQFGSGYYVYNVEKDLGKLSVGSYRGYVVVDAMDVDHVKYILTLYDNNYQIVNYDTSRGLPDVNSSQITAFSSETIESFNSEIKACHAVAENATCYNRDGNIMVAAN